MGLPLSLWPVLLVPALGGIYFAGRRLGAAATGDASLARWLAPGLGVALWLVCAQALGVAFGSFSAALWGGTLAAATAGVAAAVTWNPEAAPGQPPSGWIWLGLALALPLAYEVAFPGRGCDDVAWNVGHYSIPMEMLNGVYPPRHLVFPNFELRYHYGFDLLGALAASLFHLRVDRAVDWVTVGCFAYAIALAWLLGDRLAGRDRGWIAALAVFGGGLPLLCDWRAGRSLADHLTGFSCKVDGFWLPGPGVASFFIQHPWTLGIPLALCGLLLFDAPTGRPPRAWYAALGLVLAALSFSQAVLFACLCFGGFTAALLRAWKEDRRRIVELLLLGASVLAAARGLHGFLAPAAEPTGLHLRLVPFWIGKTKDELVLWHLYTFGLLLPLAAAGLWIAGPRGRSLALMTLAGLAVLNFFQYPSSGDVVKFAIVCGIPVGVLAAVALARFWRQPWAPVALALSLLGSAAWLVQSARSEDTCYVAPVPAGEEAQAADWLRRNARAGEGVFGTRSMEPYAIWGGLPINAVDQGVHLFGFSQPLLDERARLERDPDPAALVRAGFPWVLVRPSDARFMRWVQEGRARVAAMFGGLSILRLGGGSG